MIYRRKKLVLGMLYWRIEWHWFQLLRIRKRMNECYTAIPPHQIPESLERKMFDRRNRQLNKHSIRVMNLTSSFTQIAEIT